MLGSFDDLIARRTGYFGNSNLAESAGGKYD